MRFVTSLFLALVLAGRLAGAVPTSASEAEALTKAAQAALLEADAKPERVVDAAIAFGEALKWYEQSGDIDQTCEMQANIFWCKKRMDLDQLTTYVAQKSQDAGAKAALATVEAVTARKVDADQAQIYFDRAKSFADTHADAYLKIAIRYFEVAERFQGSDVSLKAQRLSLDAQQRYAKAPAAAKPLATTDAPLAVEPARAKTAFPAPEALKEASLQLRDILKDDFAKQKPRQRLALYDKLLVQADGRDNDPAVTGALLSEARDIAIALRDPLRTLGACDRLASDFTGVDGPAISKLALSRIVTVPASAAFAKLIDKPDDADANLIAGRYAAFEAADWEHALPLLAKGADAALAKAAQLELAKPAAATKRAEIADQWYDLGKKLGGKTKESAWWHALDIYEDVAPAIQGITHALIVKRMDEMTTFLPLPADLDYSKLSAAQWGKIKAPVVEVQARLERNETGIRVTSTKSYRVIPHPTDTWHLTSAKGGGIELNTTYKGDTMRRARIGTLQCQVGNGTMQPAGVVSGDGALTLSGDFPRGRAFTASGFIRVKIIAVEAD